MLCPTCSQRFGEGTNCPHDGSELVKDPFIGTVIRGRRVQRFIGQGGMGVVYEVVHEDLGRVEALKLLRATVAAVSPDLVRRFKVEAKAVSKLTNPHTVRVYDSGSTPEGHLYLTMEVLDGRSLEQVLKDEKALRPERCADIVYQVCESLAEAHEKEVVHRDIKPGNLMLERDERGRDFVRVLDFGIARVNSASIAQSRAGSVVGSPPYMSPEQCRGNTHIDHRTDLYSVGVVLYEMLTGENPFLGDNLVTVFANHATLAPPPPVSPHGDVPPALADLTMSLLAKDPAQRPQSMTEVMERLRGAGLVHDERSRITAERAALDAERSALAARHAELEARQAALAAQGKRRNAMLAAVVLLVLAAGAVVLLKDNKGAAQEVDAGVVAAVDAAVTPTPVTVVDAAPKPEPVPVVDAAPEPAPDAAVDATRPDAAGPTPEELVSKGRSQADAEEWDQALTTLQQAAEASPEHAGVKAALGEVQAGYAKAQLDAGLKLVRRKKFDEAQELQVALSERAFAEEEARKLAWAIKKYRPRDGEPRPKPRPNPAAGKCPPISDGEFSKLISDGMKNMSRNPKAAVAAFEKARCHRPGATQPHQRLCALHERQKNYAAAIRECQQWAAKTGNTPFRRTIMERIKRIQAKQSGR